MHRVGMPSILLMPPDHPSMSVVGLVAILIAAAQSSESPLAHKFDFDMRCLAIAILGRPCSILAAYHHKMLVGARCITRFPVHASLYGKKAIFILLRYYYQSSLLFRSICFTKLIPYAYNIYLSLCPSLERPPRS